MSPGTPIQLFLVSYEQLQISSAEKKKLKKMWKLCSPLLKYLATSLPTLVVGEKIWSLILGPPTLEMLSPSLVTIVQILQLFQKFKIK